LHEVTSAYRTLVEAAAADALSMSYVDSLRLSLLETMAKRSMLLDGDTLAIAAAVAAFPDRKRLDALNPEARAYLAVQLDRAEAADRAMRSAGGV